MKQKIEKDEIAWLDFSEPETSDLLFLKEEFHLNKSVLAQLPVPIKRPKIEEFGGYLFLVLHFPVFNEETRQTVPTELDFIITPSNIITLHHEPIPALEKFFDECLNQEISREEHFKSTGYLLFCVLDKLIDSCLPMLDHIYENIEKIEDKIFLGHEKEMLAESAIVKRDIIDFRRTIKPQRSALEILAKKVNRFFGQDLDFVTQEVLGSNIRVWNILENHKELIESIEATNESLLSYKTNNIVKVLTLLSFITFPLSLIASIFAMNTSFNYSMIRNPYAFWVVIGGMGLVTLVMLVYFKKKKWL
ncbi:MAG: magnesium transporter CorA family protein [Candidatus Portnoybacteria bacterium]|nr:magnesium transporter CorA family protein [Candidatus Portnoybacteria bacterium]